MEKYRRCFRLLVLATLIFVFSTRYLFAQYETKEEAKKASPDSKVSFEDKKDSEEKPAEVNNKLCPADFRKITTGNKFTYTYKGKIYRFDSSKCIEEFKNDPAKYLEEWEKKERLYRINIIYD